MRQKLLFTTEGRILIAGFALFLLLLIMIGYFAFNNIDISKTLGLVFFVHTFGGRAAGIGLCIMREFAPVVTIGYNFYIEILIVCFTYSIFALTTNNYIRVIWVTNLMEILAHKALIHKTKIKSYGWVGLFLFVMLPFPLTGPVMGTVIGYMLKINVFKNFTATGLGTLTAIIIWFFFFDFLEQQYHAIQYIFAGLVIIALISYHKVIIRLIRSIKISR
jgi:uncharacterized membrane protein